MNVPSKMAFVNIVMLAEMLARERQEIGAFPFWEARINLLPVAGLGLFDATYPLTRNIRKRYSSISRFRTQSSKTLFLSIPFSRLPGPATKGYAGDRDNSGGEVGRDAGTTKWTDNPF
jgi:hypothetical protein